MNDAVPFCAAIAMFLIGPLLTAKAKREVTMWIGRSAKFDSGDGKAVPAYLTPEHVGRYVEYAADVVQIAPAVTLTIVSATVLNPGSFTPAWTASFVAATVVAILILEHFVIASPERYLRTKKWGVSVVSAVGISLNGVGLVAFYFTEH